MRLTSILFLTTSALALSACGDNDYRSASDRGRDDVAAAKERVDTDAESLWDQTSAELRQRHMQLQRDLEAFRTEVRSRGSEFETRFQGTLADLDQRSQDAQARIAELTAGTMEASEEARDTINDSLDEFSDALRDAWDRLDD